jgi:hypothetical protein
MPYEPLQDFTKGRIRAILGKHGEAIQAPHYSFLRKIQSGSVKTHEDLERIVSECASKGLKREALEEIAPLVRSDLWIRKKK